RTKLDPMNPAPPVTRSLTAATLGDPVAGGRTLPFPAAESLPSSGAFLAVHARWEGGGAEGRGRQGRGGGLDGGRRPRGGAPGGRRGRRRGTGYGRHRAHRQALVVGTDHQDEVGAGDRLVDDQVGPPDQGLVEELGRAQGGGRVADGRAGDRGAVAGAGDGEPGSFERSRGPGRGAGRALPVQDPDVDVARR